MIQSDAFPTEGIWSIGKYDAERLLQVAERAQPGFCTQHGIPLDGDGYLPSGSKFKHQKLIGELWGKIPLKAKQDFLVGQYLAAKGYLSQCLTAFSEADVDIPEGYGVP